MKLIHASIVLASAALLMAGCGPQQAGEEEKNTAAAEEDIMKEEGFSFVELDPQPLPCSKEKLQAAWKQIGVIEKPRMKPLDYRQHTPTHFISTDLDKDGNIEVLLHGEEPYAAIFSCLKDSLHLITFVEHPKLGLGITQDGVVMRSGTNSKGAFVTQFIKLKNSQIVSTGESQETFTIHGSEMVSGGMHYMLQGDTSLVEVSKQEYEQMLPNQEVTYFETLDGWEDFRKP